MASCTLPEAYPGVPLDYDNVVKIFLKAEQLGIYNVHGGDESSRTIFRWLCLTLEDGLFCAFADFSD